MRSKEKSVLLFLATSGFSDQVILDFLKVVCRYGADDTLLKVKTAKKEIDRLSIEQKEFMHEKSYQKPKSSSGNISEEISRLLLTEAGLTSKDAARQLQQKILEKGIYSHVTPNFQPKGGFKKWVDSLLNKMPPSELLHYATMLRNELVHNPASEWPLRNRED